ETPQSGCEVPVGARIVLSPTGIALAPVHHHSPAETAPAAAAESGVGVLGIHQAGENVLGAFLPVRRYGDLVIPFQAGINAERLLQGVNRSDEQQAAGGQT